MANAYNPLVGSSLGIAGSLMKRLGKKSSNPNLSRYGSMLMNYYRPKTKTPEASPPKPAPAPAPPAAKPMSEPAPTLAKAPASVAPIAGSPTMASGAVQAPLSRDKDSAALAKLYTHRQTPVAPIADQPGTLMEPRTLLSEKPIQRSEDYSRLSKYNVSTADDPTAQERTLLATAGMLDRMGANDRADQIRDKVQQARVARGLEKSEAARKDELDLIAQERADERQRQEELLAEQERQEEEEYKASLPEDELRDYEYDEDIEELAEEEGTGKELISYQDPYDDIIPDEEAEEYIRSLFGEMEYDDNKDEIRSLYGDMMSELDEDWEQKQRAIMQDAAMGSRLAAAANAQAGRGMGGGFLAGQRQANIAGQQLMAKAGLDHRDLMRKVMSEQTGALITEDRLAKDYGMKVDTARTGALLGLGIKDAEARADYFSDVMGHVFRKGEMREAATAAAEGAAAAGGEEPGLPGDSPGTTLDKDGQFAHSVNYPDVDIPKATYDYTNDLRTLVLTQSHVKGMKDIQDGFRMDLTDDVHDWVAQQIQATGEVPSKEEIDRYSRKHMVDEFVAYNMKEAGQDRETAEKRAILILAGLIGHPDKSPLTSRDKNEILTWRLGKV